VVDAVAALRLEERHVERHELLERLDHAQHERCHLAADHRDVLDLLAQRGLLRLLGGDQLLELCVVDAQGLDALGLFAILPEQLVGLI
jgi:hypothetical protein